MKRRHALALALASTWAPLPAVAATLPAPKSLRDELARALAAGKPLVVMASLHGCPFCREARDSYLEPMLRETGQPIVQLDTASDAVVIDFDGVRRTHDEVLRSWKVRVYPTVLFFGREAREAAPRLAGASIPDFYGAYLDERVRVATQAVRKS